MTEPQAENAAVVDRRVGIVGLGSMGGAMAATFVRAGWEVSGFDPSEAAVQKAAEAGVRTVGSVADLAGLPFIVLSLPAARNVEATVPGLFTVPGTFAVVDTTTSEPATTRKMVALAAEHGAHFVDCPVSGGNAGAATGTLSGFVGGSTEALAAVGPVLAVLTGGKWRHIGPAGAGNVVKLLNNILCSTNLVAVAEAMDIAAAYGIDLNSAVGALNTATGASTVSQKMFPDWILSGTFDSGFALGLMARDVDLAIDVAERGGARPRVMAATQQAWQKALAELGPRADFVSATSVFTTATRALSPEELQGLSAKGTDNA